MGEQPYAPQGIQTYVLEQRTLYTSTRGIWNLLDELHAGLQAERRRVRRLIEGSVLAELFVDDFRLVDYERVNVVKYAEARASLISEGAAALKDKLVKVFVSSIKPAPPVQTQLSPEPEKVIGIAHGFYIVGITNIEVLDEELTMVNMLPREGLLINPQVTLDLILRHEVRDI